MTRTKDRTPAGMGQLSGPAVSVVGVAGSYWTADRVKAELPNVKVEYNGRESWALVRGRTLPYAKLSIDKFPGSFECRWEVIANCLNTGKPVQC